MHSVKMYGNHMLVWIELVIFVGERCIGRNFQLNRTGHLFSYEMLTAGTNINYSRLVIYGHERSLQ